MAIARFLLTFLSGVLFRPINRFIVILELSAEAVAWVITFSVLHWLEFDLHVF